MERFTQDGKVHFRDAPKWWMYIYPWSFIARHLIHAIYDIDGYLMTKEEYQTEVDSALQKISRCITERYLPYCKNKGIALVVVLHPLENELRQQAFSLQPIADSLKPFSDVLLINLYDQIKADTTYNDERYKDLYWPMDGHFNAKGYALWARIVHHEIAEPIHSLTTNTH
jgi:lysophospholipase L1-like esterase